MSERVFPPMGLPRRLGILVAVMSVLLVLAATEIALRWSERSRLVDLRLETEALSRTLVTFLNDLAPRGEPELLSQAFAGWTRQHITETRAWVFATRQGHLALAASSDSVAPTRPDSIDAAVLRTRQPRVTRETGASPAWLVTAPLGTGRPYGVLDLRVSTSRLEAWSRLERQRAYGLTIGSALLVALGVAVLTALWVGRPLSELSRAMAGAHGGAGGSPAAAEVGPTEFRAVARRYNSLREALALREKESEARAALLALEERARSLDRLALREETTAGLAHEIGTPLNTLSGHLQLLREDLVAAGDEASVERIQLLLGQVDRMERIVRAGLERGKWPHPIASGVPLGPVADRLLRFMEPSLMEAGVRASLSKGSRDVEARCDPHMVEQILLNLIKNAVEALLHGGEITVITGAENGNAFVEVADDGPGLADAARAQLFNPFATTKGPAGTGLGLAVSRRLAREMGGDLLHIPSERGTRWRLNLPVMEP